MDQKTFLYILGGITFVYVLWIFLSKKSTESHFKEDVFDQNFSDFQERHSHHKAGTSAQANNEGESKAPRVSLPSYVLSGNKPHEILGVDVDASELQVKNAYKHLMKICHPDRFKHDEDKAHAAKIAAKINAAKIEMIKQVNARANKARK